MELLSPVPEKSQARLKMAPAIGDLKDKTVGFIDNGWWSMGVIFDVLEQELKERHGIARGVRQGKNKSSPTPRLKIEALAQQCTAVITGLGN